MARAHEWDAGARPDHEVPDGALVTLGFDGAKSGDHTALIGCEVETGHIFTLGVWDPEDYDGEAPRSAIHGAVEHAFGRWDVVGFYADRHPWQSYIDAWAESYGERLLAHASQEHPIEWDMSGRRTEDDPDGVGGSRPITRAVEAFHDAVIVARAQHCGRPGHCGSGCPSEPRQSQHRRQRCSHSYPILVLDPAPPARHGKVVFATPPPNQRPQK